MKVELLNEIIQYMMSRPYKEVYELMDEVRAEVAKINNQAQAQEQEPVTEEPKNGN